VAALRALLLASLLLPLAAVHLLALEVPFYWRFAALLLWYALLCWLLFEHRARRRRRLDVFLAVAVLNLLVLTPELGLRLAGFRHLSGIHFGYPRPAQFLRLEPDPELFWTLPRDRPGVNSWGFPGPEIGPKPAATRRLLVLGDSVPYGGYPRIVEQLVNARLGPPRCQVVNLSLTGYSSHQGLALLLRHGAAVAPDLAVVSYGWNDHWLTPGASDAERLVPLRRGWAARGLVLLERRSRLLQLGGWLRQRWREQAAPAARLRVPPERYRANLRAIGRWLARRDAIPLFLTPPAAHRKLGVPPYLVEQGFAPDAGAVISRHRQYNAIVRQLAAEEGWAVLDLEARIEALDPLDEIFTADGIHLTATGNAVVAVEVAGAVVELLAAGETAVAPDGG